MTNPSPQLRRPPLPKWLVPAVLAALLCLAGLLAPVLSPQNPYDLESLRLEDNQLSPAWVRDSADAWRYPLGTDLQGRDMLSAMLYGLRVSLLVGVAATALAMASGVGLGLAAGWKRGWIESAIMRVADVQMAFPSILIALFMMALWGQGLGKIIIAVGLVHWVIYARTVRGSVMAEREKDYVQAARALGVSGTRIVLRHILPNVSEPILVISAVEFASVVMLEATLSFLGLGVPLTRPSLGLLIKFGYDEFMGGAWWIWLFPGLTLVALVLSLNWLADALRDRLNPPTEN